MSIVSWENLEGGQESSHHSGDVYRDQVRDYFESMEYLEKDDPYSGVSDICLTRPAHNEDKVFRVETKNSKVSLTDEDLCNEIARHFIDYCEQDQEFELYIVAEDFAYQRKKWRAAFSERHRKPEKVREFQEAVLENNTLSGVEAEKLEQLDEDQFREFMGKIGIKKAGYGRLGELIEENNQENRREKKWEFYVTEKKPVPEEGELIPNITRITGYPDYIWEIPAQGISYNDLITTSGVPRCIPVWVEHGKAFSLISPDNLPDSLPSGMPVDSNERKEFSQWMEEQGVTERMVKILLAKKIAWRATLIEDSCIVVKDRKLIHQVGNKTVQKTLTGDTQRDDEDPNRSEVSTHTRTQSYMVTRTFDDAVGHRYCKPIIRKYNSGYYLFLETGWVFSKHGNGREIIGGSWASRLHDTLRSKQYDHHTNYRAQLRFWRSYLRLGLSDESPPDTPGIQPTQKMSFSIPGEFTLHPRPPNDHDEWEKLKEGEAVAE